MTMNAITLVVADSGAVVGWTIAAVTTFLLIGAPLMYLFVLTFANEDDSFDRQVRDIAQYVDLRDRAQAYAWSKAGPPRAASGRERTQVFDRSGLDASLTGDRRPQQREVKPAPHAARPLARN
jgi:hypothetical protein